jgi:histidine ammonia-lyase
MELLAADLALRAQRKERMIVVIELLTTAQDILRHCVKALQNDASLEPDLANIAGELQTVVTGNRQGAPSEPSSSRGLPS